ncbi:hypothetical protein ACSVIT_11270 [Vogesella indigofera]
MHKRASQVTKQPLHSKHLGSNRKSIGKMLLGWLIKPETWHFLIVKLPGLIEKISEFFDNI